MPEVRLDMVAENLRSESPAQCGNAFEVLDNALPEPWKRLVMAALDETKRRQDHVAADPRPSGELIGALIATESGLWVGACAARYALDAPVPIAPLVPMLQSALHSAAAPLREAAALALAVAAGAFGAHGLRGRLDDYRMSVYERAVFYHFIHAIGLLVVPLLMRGSGAGRVCILLAAGIVLFSGSLYALALSGVRALGMITPFGGVAFIAAWVLLAFELFRHSR